MKRILAVLAAMLLLFCMSACNTSENQIESDIIITDDIYCETVNDIYTNYKEYIGKTIELDGVFGYYYEDEIRYNYIFRHGPGCCDYDGDVCGFEFEWDGEQPNEGDWISIAGVLELHEEEHDAEILEFISLNVTSLETHGEAEEDDITIDHPQKKAE
jgi:uncharacterized membrane protein YcgQ (UPF0703/DUF1980 family)